MKKAIVFIPILLAVLMMSVHAQDQNIDPKVMLQRMTGRVKPDMMSKLKLTENRVEKAKNVQSQWQR
jgi:hypothetical protein